MHQSGEGCGGGARVRLPGNASGRVHRQGPPGRVPLLNERGLGLPRRGFENDLDEETGGVDLRAA